MRIRGAVAEEGTMDTCGWATYNPVLCEEIRVVKANIQLAKIAPAEVLRCDPIPVILTVKNNGSSALSDVQVTDRLPDGLTCDGKSTVTFNVGNLAPGEIKELKFTAMASKAGQFQDTATVTSAQGVKAQASATTIAREP